MEGVVEGVLGRGATALVGACWAMPCVRQALWVHTGAWEGNY